MFVHSVAPHGRLGDHVAIHQVTAKVFAVARVNAAKGGTGVSRHNVESMMRAATTPLPATAAGGGRPPQEGGRPPQEGLAVQTAKDIVLTVMGPDTYRMLSVDRGWECDKILKWMRQTMKVSLLPVSSI